MNVLRTCAKIIMKQIYKIFPYQTLLKKTSPVFYETLYDKVSLQEILLDNHSMVVKQISVPDQKGFPGFPRTYNETFEKCPLSLYLNAAFEDLAGGSFWQFINKSDHPGIFVRCHPLPYKLTQFVGRYLRPWPNHDNGCHLLT